jgi:PiT family inorganic phosphate transporter
MSDLAFFAFVFSVALGYVYAFMGGFTDAANAIATAVGTRAFTPLQAVVVAGLFELLGALTGTAVALTIGQGIVERPFSSQATVCAALVAAMCWSFVTFLRGIPVSETHGLIGGIVGAGLAAGGFAAVEWLNVIPVLLAIVVSPLLGFFGAGALLVITYRLCVRVERARAAPLFMHLQRLSSIYMAFSHGRNDAQKPMGIIAMALATYQGREAVSVPLWIILSAALVASAGVAAGGWRIIRTLGSRLTALRPVQGFAAEAASATVLQIASAYGIPVSTTHAITAAIVGAGSVHGKNHVRWHVVVEITLSWVLTLPATITLGYVFARLLALLVRG